MIYLNAVFIGVKLSSHKLLNIWVYVVLCHQIRLPHIQAINFRVCNLLVTSDNFHYLELSLKVFSSNICWLSNLSAVAEDR